MKGNCSHKKSPTGNEQRTNFKQIELFSSWDESQMTMTITVDLETSFSFFLSPFSPWPWREFPSLKGDCSLPSSRDQRGNYHHLFFIVSFYQIGFEFRLWFRARLFYCRGSRVGVGLNSAEN